MRVCRPFLWLAAAVVVCPALQASAGETNDSRTRAADALATVVTDRRLPAAPPEDQYRRYIDALKTAADLLGTESRVAAKLTAAIDSVGASDSEGPETIEQLRSVARQCHADLAFRPLIEADMPRGFPAPTPAGEIEVKQYPTYRMAQAAASQSSAFWALFRHIKREKIAMTAPVQMQLPTNDAATGRNATMAFLYGSPDLGRAGASGSVDVVDVPPMTVLSIGMRGNRTDRRLEEARVELSRWLEAHASQYGTTGGYRVMGYNSPFVPTSRRYFEIQIPLRAKTSSATVQDQQQPAPAAA